MPLIALIALGSLARLAGLHTLLLELEQIMHVGGRRCDTSGWCRRRAWTHDAPRTDTVCLIR